MARPGRRWSNFRFFESRRDDVGAISLALKIWLELVSKIGFVSGHDFSRAARGPKNQGFQPLRVASCILYHHLHIFETRSKEVQAIPLKVYG